MNDRNFGEFLPDGFFHHHRRLDGIIGGKAEYRQILNTSLAPLCHRGRACRRGNDFGNTFFLQMFVTGQRDTCIHRADYAGQIIHRGQFLADQSTAFVLTFIIAFNHFDFHILAGNADATRRIDLGNGELGAISHGGAHRC